MKFKVDFTTYLGVYKTVETEKLNVPTSEGRRTILSNHMPIMLSLDLGVVETLEEGIINRYVVNGGVLYFENNVAEIVADNVLTLDDIDVERAAKSLEKARISLEKASRENERIKAQEKYDIANFILKTAEKYKEQ